VRSEGENALRARTRTTAKLQERTFFPKVGEEDAEGEYGESWGPCLKTGHARRRVLGEPIQRRLSQRIGFFIEVSTLQGRAKAHLTRRKRGPAVKKKNRILVEENLYCQDSSKLLSCIAEAEGTVGKRYSGDRDVGSEGEVAWSTTTSPS